MEEEVFVFERYDHFLFQKQGEKKNSTRIDKIALWDPHLPNPNWKSSDNDD